MKELPPFDELVKMRVVYRLPGMEAVTVRRGLVYKTDGDARLEMDVYAPPGLEPGARRPALVFIHGGPIPPGSKAKGMGVYLSYGELAGASGLIGIAFDHRFHGPDRLEQAGQDVADLLGHLRREAPDLGVDPDRIAVWAFSGGGPFLAPLLAERPPWLRAVAAFYAALDLQVPPPGRTDTLGPELRRRFSPVAHLGPGTRPLPPLLVGRAGLDHPFLNEGTDRFVREALAQNASIDVLNHPEGRHGFDTLDGDERTREMVARALAFLSARLSPLI
ncbi:MAG TPA: alpha/beta hydrolase [Vicinamibacteria bacterium]